MSDWKISKECENISTDDVTFVTGNSQSGNWIRIDRNILTGGTFICRSPAFPRVEKESFRRDFEDTSELWIHLLDNTKAGKVFIQLMLSEVSDLQRLSMRTDIRKLVAPEKKVAGNKKSPGVYESEFDASDSTKKMWHPDYSIEKEYQDSLSNEYNKKHYDKF